MGQEVQIAAADGGKFVGYLSLPASPRAPGLIVLPEVFNTNPHIRSVADGYAAAGFVTLAPDVYWRQEAGNYLPYTDEGRAKAQSLRARLDTDQFTRDLGDAIAALRARPECTGKVGVMGFCLGGKFAYLASTRLPIEAAVSYYGVQIDEHLDEADRLKCPILMHFAENDPHVPAPTVAAISNGRIERREHPCLPGHGTRLQPARIPAVRRDRGCTGAPTHIGAFPPPPVVARRARRASLEAPE